MERTLEMVEICKKGDEAKTLTYALMAFLLSSANRVMTGDACQQVPVTMGRHVYRGGAATVVSGVRSGLRREKKKERRERGRKLTQRECVMTLLV